jgi:hypothetical protein
MGTAMTPLEKAIARINELTTEEDWQIAATCHGLLVGYDARWSAEQSRLKLIECEGCYTAPLTNIETNRISRTYKTAGKVDKLVDDGGKRKLIDHKTTTQDIGDPTSAYWRQLAVDSQASHYELLLLANGIRLDGIVWDVVRKPGIRPKQIAAKILKAALSESTYCGFDITTETLKWLAAGNDRENGELYAARLAEETINEPDRYFARRSNPRTSEQLVEYAKELWGMGKDIRHAELNNEHFRNSGACFNYGTPCEFLSLCSGCDTPESDRWQKKPKKHAELPDDIGGHDVLTNSRLRVFATCRRKHYYQYELGIERFDAERREALYFGSVFHEALDAWWKAHDERQRDGKCNEQPASSAGSRQAPQLAF